MRLLSLILAVLMMLSFVACSDEAVEQSDAGFSKAESVAASTPDDESAEASKEESTAVSEDASEPADESSEPADESSEPADESSEPADESSEPDEDTSEPDEEEYELPTYADIEIGKAETAPVVDGEVGKNEYATNIEFDLSKTHWNFHSDEEAEAYDVTLHISWDEEYLYTAVSLRVGMPRTYDNTDFTQNRPYIFDRRHVMTAVVTGDPTDAKYFEPSGANFWDWGAAYNSGLASEWTITAQPDGSNIHTDHFGSVTQSGNFDYRVGVSKLDFEVYEQKIPWAALAGGANFTPEEGAIIGYAFSACCEEVDITVDTDPNAIYACFGGGIIGGKSFSEYVGLTLAE